MILVTGGTGFIGQVLIRQLVESGYNTRVLLRPSPASPRLPRGLPVEAAISSLNDPRGIRAAMVDVETVVHLAGVEWRGVAADLAAVDVQGTLVVLQVAAEVGVEHLIYVSHLGADRASAYPVLKAKGIAEEHIRRSGVPYTIFRSALLYGKGDGFTTSLARMMHVLPFFLLPGGGDTLVQPLWVEDLVTAMVWTLENKNRVNRTYEVGGMEFLSFRQVVEILMNRLGIQRRLIPVSPMMLRFITVIFENIFPNLPVSVYWLDYLAVNRTCALDQLPKEFGLLPVRFTQGLDYLEDRHWRKGIFSLFKRRG
ncbi:MAG: NAD-dependent epimerase/dehydratase family protein [Chloroflexota bacterium]